MSGPWRRAAELRALVDEVAPTRWRHDPAWWGIIGAAALLEPRGRRAGAAYLVSNAEPSHDTFMALARPGPSTRAAWIAWAVSMAHAAVRAIAALDGTLPGQPLAVTIANQAGLAAPVPVEALARVAFAIGDRVWSGRLDPRGPAHDAELARALARTLRGQPSPLVAHGPRPAIVIALGDDDPARAHHGHRRAWDERGGPWLGVARADGLTVVSTCHLVVDGFGHALLARAIAATAIEPQLLAAAEVACSADATDLPPLRCGDGEPLDVAWRRLPPLPGFPQLAYALGRALHRERGEAGATCSPTFQLPVAPGAVDDGGRFAHRVRPALLSVRFSDGRPEPFDGVDGFAARAKRAVAREADGAGLVSRLLVGLAGIPLPTGVRRRVLVGAPSRWAAGPTELLAGDGCLSLLRLDHEAPLIAVSAPPPQLPRSRSSSVLTVVRDAGGTTVTLAAVGPRRAAALLDEWLALLADSPRS